MDFSIGGAILGGIEGFLMTGNPIGAGIGAVDGGLDGGQADGMGGMGMDSLSSGGSDASTLMAFSQLADAAG